MTTLQEATTATTLSTRLVERVARGLGRFSRRGFLVQTAVVGSALAVDPKGYVLTPQTAASTVCGPAASCSAGYTVMCCTINRGHNSCPPGTIAAGWWKAAGSSWCGGGYRYIVDCNATCSDCTSGCSGDHICDRGCWSCNCRCGPSSSCDQRKVCCNGFRYGQCNTHVRCTGGVACRVVSCVAPYKWANCTTTSLTDNATAEHSAPCLPRSGPIQRKYDELGSNGGWLGASTNAIRSVGDKRGEFLTCEHGRIYWAWNPGAHAIRTGWMLTRWLTRGGTTGDLAYPTSEAERAADGEGTIQFFEKGVITRSPGGSVGAVWASALTEWKKLGRETGVMGYPATDREYSSGGSWWVQRFQHGALSATSHGLVHVVGQVYSEWLSLDRERGALGYAIAQPVAVGGGSVQRFQRGRIGARPGDGAAYAVLTELADRWASLDDAAGVLGFPRAREHAGRDDRGRGQRFDGGELWQLGTATPRTVRGRVLQRWLDDGAETGRWGYPLGDTVVNADGSEEQRFEGGQLTA